MEKLENYMKELNLKRMREIYQEEAKKAAESRMDYVDYLSRLLEEEYISMTERSVNQRIKRAGFPWIKTIEEYEFTCQPQLNEKRIRRLCSLDFLEEAVNPIFIGPAGVGKTHLSIGFGIKACQMRKRVMFYSAQTLIEELAKAKLTGTLGNELMRLGRLDLLIIDEMGYMNINREGALLFFQLIARRYEKGSIVLNTNRPFEEWGRIFEDNVIATAILDRLLHHSELFYITGKSYRLKKFNPKCPDDVARMGGVPS